MTDKLNSIEADNPNRCKPKRLCAWFFFLLFWWWLFRGTIQFIMFHFAVTGCSASALEDYSFFGGDWTCPSDYGTPHAGEANWHLDLAHNNATNWALGTKANGAKCKYSPRDNAVPRNFLLREMQPTFMGQAFAVYENVHGNGQITSAAVGTWFRTWGPWFWTYTYQDAHGKTTIYMRPSIMGMIGPYSETRIMRCDEQGDIWFFGEGAHWISNIFYSTFSFIFGSTRERTFILYKQHEGTSHEYGNALEKFHGDKSIQFNKDFGHRQAPIGSAILTDPPANHAHRDFWAFKIAQNTPYGDLPPYYMMSAASVLMGFRWMNVRRARGCPGGVTTDSVCNSNGRPHSPSPPPTFLAETSNASVTFFEESEEDGDENAHTGAVGEKV